jgi:hypothetical protein
MIHYLIYLDGLTIPVTREYALASLRGNRAVACVEIWDGGEFIERITR